MNLLYLSNFLLNLEDHNNENKIEVSDVFLEKLKELRDIKASISHLITERDELKYVICQNIETEYWLIFGELEKEVYEKSTEVLRLKRKIDLVQSYKNRDEDINIEEIEKILDKEFVEYQKKLEEYLQNIKLAKEYSSLEALSKEDAKKLKALYLKIVKLLHPDICKNFTESDKFLFQKALDAYKNGDLDTMILIDSLIDKRDKEYTNKNSLEELEEERHKLLSIIAKIEIEIDEIKNDVPYILKFIIDSEENIDLRRNDLLEALADYSERETIYRIKLKEMLGD
ncbi:molecular chaperone DnaJ [Peptoniphilus sp.]|jgi:hypothetical protein|uniref:molecular chaperone DnaJ n=1 Tax=Peptoniphilus sp. TaxID=1971214 RepID=UPI003D89E956